MKNKDLPAMPLTGDAYTDLAGHLSKGQGFEPECLGLTKREYFAAHAPDMPNEFVATQQFTYEEEQDDANGVEGVYLRYRLRCMIAWRWHYADMMLEGEK